MKSLAVLFATLGLAFGGCSSDETLLPKGSERVILISDEINPIIEKHEQVTFVSWDGEWIGMDCDTELTLKPDGQVEMIEYGYAVEKYAGKYKISTSDDKKHSAIFFEFDDPNVGMEPLAVYKSNNDLLLIPASGSGSFAMGNRSGATVSSGDSFWPFRQRQAKPKK